MTDTVLGCNITIYINAKNYVYTLPNGYSINRIHITYIENISSINGATLRADSILIFPPVNSKSPSSILLNITNLAKAAFIRFTIEKFGQIPDPYYFDKAFNPILVTGDDGNKYNVIPSDQFK